MAEGYMLIHHSTGLKFFCERKQPTTDDHDRWNTYIIDVHADRLRIAEQALMDGTTTEKYVEYLARASMDLADEALKKRRRGPFTRR